MDKILDGEKTLEVRSKPIHKHIGKRIALAASGTSAIFGWVELVECFWLNFTADGLPYDEEDDIICKTNSLTYPTYAKNWAVVAKKDFEVPPM